jgi:hypothetical protein
MNLSKFIYKDFAKLCQLSYFNKTEIAKYYTKRPYNTDDYNVLYRCTDTPILYSRDKDSQMIICKYNNKLSITFRGTDSYRDILTDVNINRVNLSLKNIKESHSPLVHSGFYNQFLELKQDIDQVLSDYTDNDIYFSGHSLGGALATIASLKYKYEYPEKNIHCITFGSPRVGNYKFTEYFNNKIDHSYRFVNDNDPVPCIPIALRFRHVKGCIWLYEDEIKKEIKVWRGWRFIKNYILSFIGYGYDASKDHCCEGYYRDIKYIMKI